MRRASPGTTHESPSAKAQAMRTIHSFGNSVAFPVNGASGISDPAVRPNAGIEMRSDETRCSAMAAGMSGSHISEQEAPWSLPAVAPARDHGLAQYPRCRAPARGQCGGDLHPHFPHGCGAPGGARRNSKSDPTHCAAASGSAARKTPRDVVSGLRGDAPANPT